MFLQKNAFIKVNKGFEKKRKKEGASREETPLIRPQKTKNCEKYTKLNNLYSVVQVVFTKKACYFHVNCELIAGDIE